MSVDVDDCLEPNGPIPMTLFAGETPSLEDRVDAAIEEAEARPEYANIDEDDTFIQDSAVKRWVEYRVYSALNRAATQAGGSIKSVTLNDQGSWTYGDSSGSPGAAWGKSARTALRGWQLLTAAADVGTPYRNPPVTVVEVDEGS